MDRWPEMPSVYQPCNCRKKELHTAVQKREWVAASETGGRLGRVLGMDADGCISDKEIRCTRVASRRRCTGRHENASGIPFIFQWALSRDYVDCRYRRRCHLVISSLIVPLSLSVSFPFSAETYNYSCELQRGRRREILIHRAWTLRSLAFQDDLDPLERALPFVIYRVTVTCITTTRSEHLEPRTFSVKWNYLILVAFTLTLNAIFVLGE